MDISILPLLSPYIVSCLFSFYVCIYAWRRRERAGAAPFSLIGLLAGLMTLGIILESMATTVESKLFWDNLQWIPLEFAPVVLYEFAIQFTGKPSSRRRIILHSIPAMVFVIALAGHQWAGAGAIDPHIVPANPFPILTYEFSSAMIAVSAYSILLTIAASVKLITHYLRGHSLYRMQMILIVAGFLIPSLGGIVSLFVVTEIPYGRDITPFTVMFRNLFILIGLFQYGLLDILPVAHQAIFESMDDGVFVLDRHSRLVDLNPTARQVAHEQMKIGHPLPDHFLFYEKDGEVISRNGHVQTELVLEQDNPPQEHYYDVRVYPLRDVRKRQSAGKLLVTRDITARKKSEIEREKLITELDAYAHTVAHDLKNPINVIVGFTQLLETSQLSEADRQMVDGIAQAGWKMNSIIDELLLLARIRQDDNIQTTVIDTATIIGEVEKRLQNMIHEYDVELHVPPTWLPAIGYEPWIEEIWANYISNAIKYGGRPPEICLGSSLEADGKIRFWVQDNGKGLTSEEQERLFGQFVQLDSAQSQGHGLGLSIVQRIAERLGGTVGVESQIDKGSTFYFTLPAPHKR